MSPQFNQDTFNQFVVENNVIGFFKEPVKLKSGRISHWYVNWREIADDVFLMEQLTDFVLAFTDSLIKQSKIGDKIGCFYGVPEGATKLGVLTQYKYAKRSAEFNKGSHCFPMGRAKPKEHGVARDKFFVGMPRGATIVVEDVTTTGGSLITTIEGLRAAEVEIVAAIGLTNRMEKRDDGLSVEQAIEKSTDSKAHYFHMSSALDLLPIVIKKIKPSHAIIDSIKKEFEQYGVNSIRS